jgi:hypothetical protein
MRPSLASSSLLLFLSSILVACGDDSTVPADGGGMPGDAPMTDAGPSCTELVYDPTGGDLTRWPEPALVVDDPTTVTGIRLRYDPADFSELAINGTGYEPVLTEDLSDLDGFGVNADAYFMFTRAFDEAAVPSGDATAMPSAGLGIVVLEPGPARIEPVLVRFTDEGRTPLMSPMRPLPAEGRAAVFVTRALTGAAGGCLEPSPAMRAELETPSMDVSDALAALETLGVVSGPSDLVALTVFRTQSTVVESVAIAEDIAARTFALDGPATCDTSDARWIYCDATFTVGDYRDAEDGVVRQEPGDVAPVATYRLPLSVWLPPEGEGPFPTVLFGHGLGGGRGQGEALAREAAPRGFATVAIPAVQHGDHPTSPDPDSDVLATVLRFFAIGDLSTRAVEARRLRDHFRQSTYDKLQLTRMLEDGLDVDGDGSVDLDATRLTYVGASLGGIMGSEPLALTDTYGAAVLAVPGARLTTIIVEGDLFGSLITLLRPRGVSDGDVQRFIPMLQTIFDRGDPASYAPHVLDNRLVGDPVSVLAEVALDDDTVPNEASYALARALGIPITPTVLRPQEGLVELAMTPLSGNFSDGAATGGLIQFDVIGDGTELATHSSTPDSNVAIRASFDFIDAHLDDGLAVIVDPYALLMVPHAAVSP